MPPEEDRSASGTGRRRKRFLSPSQKYEIWIGLLERARSARPPIAPAWIARR